MSRLHTRLTRLEEAAQPGVPPLPYWFDRHGDGGFEIDGEFVTWEEYERRYPDAPRVMRWSGEQRGPGGLITYGDHTFTQEDFERRFPGRDWTLILGEGMERRAVHASTYYERPHDNQQEDHQQEEA